MPDLTIAELLEQAHATALEKGWYGPDGKTERNFGEVVALMHSELSEALEEWRNSCAFDCIYTNGDKPEGIAVEFADVLIRIADTCARHGIPIEQALRAKLEFNKSRPYRHGGKLA